VVGGQFQRGLTGATLQNSNSEKTEQWFFSTSFIFYLAITAIENGKDLVR